ncbi:MAG: HEAT repeat domain-containing protein, partial [Anaerolineae bacterium]|nr:HEAT repeat domain-containing protein [Anaerolineae bacterium]
AIERLKDGASKEPKDIWNELITSAIDFSTNRLSINRQGIINVLKQSYSGVSIADNPTVRAVSDLNDPDPKKRALAIESLENLQATEQLKTALNHPYSDVRIKAALIVAKLSKYQEQAAVPTLAEALINPDKSTRIEAIVAIGRYALSDSVEIIDRLTKIAAAEDELNTSYEKPERLNALLALSQLKSPQAIQKLGEIALCRGDYPQIRLCAVIALSNTSHQDIIPFLIRIIQHKQLAKELYEIEPKSATYGIARQIKSAAARGLEPFDTVDAKKAIEEWKKSRYA